MCLNEARSDARTPSLFMCFVFNELSAVNPSRRWDRQWYCNGRVARTHTHTAAKLYPDMRQADFIFEDNL